MSGTSAERGLEDPAVPLTLSELLPPHPISGHLEELKIEKVGMALCSDEQC